MIINSMTRDDAIDEVIGIFNAVSEQDAPIDNFWESIEEWPGLIRLLYELTGKAPEEDFEAVKKSVKELVYQSDFSIRLYQKFVPGEQDDILESSEELDDEFKYVRRID